MSIGQAVIDAIINGRLINVSCPESPGSACLVVWAANTEEQISKLVWDMVREQHDGSN